MTSLATYVPQPAVAAWGTKSIKHFVPAVEIDIDDPVHTWHVDFAPPQASVPSASGPHTSYWGGEVTVATMAGAVAGGTTSLIPLPRVRTADRSTEYAFFVSSSTESSSGRFATLARLLEDAISGMNITPVELRQLIRWIVIPKVRPDRSSQIGSAISGRIDTIKHAANLTREETAQLVGVSRRALQNWLAGGPISAVRDRRLREVAAFVDEQSKRFGPVVLRDRLYARTAPYTLRAFDLVSEGAFDAAKAAIDAAEDGATSAPIGMPPRPVLELGARVISEDGRTSHPGGMPSTRLRRRAIRS